MRLFMSQIPVNAFLLTSCMMAFKSYMICEDTLVSCWYGFGRHYDQNRCGVCIGFTSARFSYMIFKLLRFGKDHCPLSCPASGRFILLPMDRCNSVHVLDFFWYITHHLPWSWDSFYRPDVLIDRICRTHVVPGFSLNITAGPTIQQQYEYGSDCLVSQTALFRSSLKLIARWMADNSSSSFLTILLLCDSLPIEPWRRRTQMI